MTLKSYDEVELGDDLPEEHPDVSLDRVREFVGATDMPFGRFTDDEVARSEGLPWAIVPGVMSQGLLAAMVHRWAPGCRILSLDTVFRSPIRVGSAPRCTAAVTDTDDDARTVEIDLTILAETGETAVMGTAVVALAD